MSLITGLYFLLITSCDPRARGAGVPKGTILCLGRVLDAHDEQDDAEGGHRDWEEDPLGFDTNPGLLRAMCMAFE